MADAGRVNYVTIGKFLNPAQADLAASRLEAAGFHVLSHSAGAALALDGYALAAGGIRLQVPDNEVTDAKELLQDMEMLSPAE